MGIKCPKCQTDNSDTQKFCGECGTQLPSPKEELTPGSSFEGRNQIIEELDKGGKVALRLIESEIAADKEMIECFKNEFSLGTLNILLFGREI